MITASKKCLHTAIICLLIKIVLRLDTLSNFMGSNLENTYNDGPLYNYSKSLMNITVGNFTINKVGSHIQIIIASIIKIKLNIVITLIISVYKINSGVMSLFPCNFISPLNTILIKLKWF